LSDHPAYRQLRDAGAKVATGIGRLVRESGFAEHWRLFVLLVVLAFFVPFVATRVLVANFGDPGTEVALVSARQENQALRQRQEVLRRQTETALARIEALETVKASYVRTP
jgi:hypothetical protein